MTDAQSDQPAPEVSEDERPGEVAQDSAEQAPGPAEQPGPAEPATAEVPDAPEAQAPVGDVEEKPAHREPEDIPEDASPPPPESTSADMGKVSAKAVDNTVTQAPTAARRGEGGGDGEVVNLQQAPASTYQGQQLVDPKAIVHANQAPTEGKPVVDDGRLAR